MARPPGDAPAGPRQVLAWLRHRLAYLVGLLLVGVMLYVAFGTPWFYIYDIEVRGAHLVTKEELYYRSQLEALSIFWLNPRVVARRLEEDPLVASAVVTGALPNRVRVQVQERVPVAVWQSGGTSHFVDEDGVLFGLRGDASQMLVVRDLRDLPVEAGGRVDPGAVRAAAELTELIPERVAYDWEPGVGISFVTDGGWRVTFGDHTRLPAKIAAYHAFREQIHPENEILLLDLSVPEHPYYRVAN
jgi:cell division septal protein FtsQ